MPIINTNFYNKYSNIIKNIIKNTDIDLKYSINEIKYNKCNYINNENGLKNFIKDIQFTINDFCNEDFIKSFYYNLIQYYSIDVEFGGKIYNNCISIYTTSSFNNNSLKTFLSEIILRLNFISLICPNCNHDPPKILLILSDISKIIPLSNFIEPFYFTSNIVNNGFTDFIKKEIIIYRKEEILKVLLHELLHYHNLDNYSTSNKINSKIFNSILKFYNLPNNNYYNFNEGLTECYALIYHHLIYSVKKKKSNIKKIHLLNKILEQELTWNYFQIAKICYLTNNLHNTNDTITYFNNLKQSTDVFSYFILKTLLLKQFNSNDNIIIKVKNYKLLEKDIILYISKINQWISKNKTLKLNKKKHYNNSFKNKYSTTWKNKLLLTRDNIISMSMMKPIY